MEVLHVILLIASFVMFLYAVTRNSDGKCDSSDCEHCPFPQCKFHKDDIK